MIAVTATLIITSNKVNAAIAFPDKPIFEIVFDRTTRS